MVKIIKTCWLELYSKKKFCNFTGFRDGAKQIALIDDDNIPYNNWFKINYLNKKAVNKYSLNKYLRSYWTNKL